MQRKRTNSKQHQHFIGGPAGYGKKLINGERQNPGIVTIKKLCDGFEITLGEFFDTKEYDGLEREIK